MSDDNPMSNSIEERLMALEKDSHPPIGQIQIWDAIDRLRKDMDALMGYAATARHQIDE